MQPRLERYTEKAHKSDRCPLRKHLRKCHADMEGEIFPECGECPINAGNKCIDVPLPRSPPAPSEQRCMNFNADSNLCWQCMNKRAGKGKICHKTLNPVHIRNRKNHQKRGRTLRDQQAKEDWQNFLKKRGLK